MAKINSFQDLNIWKEGHRMLLEIYQITKNFPNSEIFCLTSQIRRSAYSITANISEGMGRNTTKELIAFVYNARGSLLETMNYLLLAKDLKYISNSEFQGLYDRYDGLLKGINSFLAKLKNTLKK